MFIEVITIEFYLAGCNSLKQKRQRLSGLRDKFGKLPHVAVIESGAQDVHKRAQWSFTICSTDQKVIDKTASQIEQWVQTEVDAEVQNIVREKM